MVMVVRFFCLFGYCFNSVLMFACCLFVVVVCLFVIFFKLVKLHQPNDMIDDERNDRLGCFITGTALNNDIYRFLQFHFHWRNSHSSGSEHAIDGRKFTMEVCFVDPNIKH